MPVTDGIRWWTFSVQPDELAGWEVKVQFETGPMLVLHLLPEADVDAATRAGVQAHLRRDRRWTPGHERG